MNILYTIVNYITDIVRFPQINVKYLFRTDSHGRKQKFYNEKAVGKTYDFFTKNSRQISEKMTNLK